MKNNFKLVGMSKPQSFTCEPLDKEEIFWAKNGMGLEKFNELWNYQKGHWEKEGVVEIEHDGLRQDGTPINPVVVGVVDL